MMIMKVKEIAAVLLLLVCFSCKKSAAPAAADTKPAIKITDVTLNRDVVSTTFRFYINLTSTSTSSVSVDYTTVDGTAKANIDYTPKSGTLTLNANQTDAYIDVIVTGDSLRKDSQQFYVQLSNPVNGTLSVNKGTGTIQDEGTYLPTDNTG